MKDYVELSLEFHLFFARIMKEHSLFLEAAFMKKDSCYIEKACYFRTEFEQLLAEAVRLSDGIVGGAVLKSGEVVTCFTQPAEEKTSRLAGIPINSRITEQQKCLKPGGRCSRTREQMMMIRKINKRALELTGGLIDFKEEILREVSACRLFTANYPLLIQHIMREARLYQSFLRELESRGTISQKCIRETEAFWNQIMMEHALFIRGLLDPAEEELIAAADGFAADYKKLLAQARSQDCKAMDALTQKTLQETKKYRDFKAAGTKGITECEISAVILPLLADHVLREANHYLRILGDIAEQK